MSPDLQRTENSLGHSIEMKGRIGTLLMKSYELDPTKKTVAVIQHCTNKATFTHW
jgi:hypothetical protein